MSSKLELLQQHLKEVSERRKRRIEEPLARLLLKPTPRAIFVVELTILLDVHSLRSLYFYRGTWRSRSVQEQEDNASMQEMLNQEIDDLNAKHRNLQSSHKHILSKIQTTLQDLEALQSSLAYMKTQDFSRQDVQHKLENIIEELKRDDRDSLGYYEEGGDGEGSDEEGSYYSDEYDERGDTIYEDEEEEGENDGEEEADNFNEDEDLHFRNNYESREVVTRSRTRTEDWINQGRQKGNVKSEVSELVCVCCC